MNSVGSGLAGLFGVNYCALLCKNVCVKYTSCNSFLLNQTTRISFISNPQKTTAVLIFINIISFQV